MEYLHTCVCRSMYLRGSENNAIMIVKYIHDYELVHKRTPILTFKCLYTIFEASTNVYFT